MRGGACGEGKPAETCAGSLLEIQCARRRGNAHAFLLDCCLTLHCNPQQDNHAITLKLFQGLSRAFLPGGAVAAAGLPGGAGRRAGQSCHPLPAASCAEAYPHDQQPVGRRLHRSGEAAVTDGHLADWYCLCGGHRGQGKRRGHFRCGAARAQCRRHRLPRLVSDPPDTQRLPQHRDNARRTRRGSGPHHRRRAIEAARFTVAITASLWRCRRWA